MAVIIFNVMAFVCINEYEIERAVYLRDYFHCISYMKMYLIFKFRFVQVL